MTTTLDCLVCQTPTSDTFLCAACWNQLAVELADLAGYQRNDNGDRMIPMAVELEIVLSRQDRLGKVSVQVSGTTERPLPVNLHAGRVRDRLHGVLAGWVTRICLTHVYCQDAAATMVQNAQWLLRHEHEVRGLHDVDALFTSITEAIDAARRVIDNRSVRVYVGKCGAQVEDPGEDPWTCDADLWADSSYAMTRCSFCDTSWPSMDRWELYRHGVRTERLASIRGLHMGPRRMARALTALGVPIDESAIRKMSKTGRITSTGHDEHKRRVYRVGDVLSLVERPAQGEAELIHTA